MKNKRTIWYKKFNETNNNEALMENEIVEGDDIIIAKRYKEYNQWHFTKFSTLDEFVRFYKQTSKKQRTFLVVLRHNYRYIYLDIDYKLSTPLSQKQCKILRDSIIHCINKTYARHRIRFNFKQNNPLWYVWDATRPNKFSIHLICPHVVMHYERIKEFAILCNEKLHLSTSANINLKIDSLIYRKNYQPWRLPYNHTGNIQSELKLITPMNLTLYQQFDINCMNNTKVRTHANAPLVCIPQIKRDPIIFTECKQRNQRNINSISQDNLLNQVQKIFCFSTYSTNNKNEFIVRKNYCPIRKGTHTNNTARIAISNAPNCPNSCYYAFTCMDQRCQKKQHVVYGNLQSNWYRPWVMATINVTDTKILREIDNFINQLFLSKTIKSICDNNHHEILKPIAHRYNTPGYTFTSFFTTNIIHIICRHNDIAFHYKCRMNPNAIRYGNTAIYCVKCKRYINYHNDKIIQH